MNRAEAIETIRRLETKHQLYAIKREDFSVYQLIAVPTTMNLITDQSIRTSEGRIGRIIRRYKTSATIPQSKQKSLRIVRPGEKAVVFMLRGRYTEDGCDNLLDEYYRYYENAGYRCIPIDRYLDGKNAPNRYEASFSTDDFKIYSKQFVGSDIVTWTPEELAALNAFETDLLANGYTGMPIVKLLTMKLRDYYIDKLNYKLFFQMNHVEKVFLSLGYAHQGMIHAAKELGITTVEVQYANISELHPGFAFSAPSVVTADYLVAWGPVFGERLHFNPSKVLYRCPAFLEDQSITKKDQILVVVQKLEYKDFEALIEPLSKHNPYPIIFRMPLGVNFERSFIQKLKQYRVQVEYSDDVKSTFERIQESKWVISGYSTALIESMSQNSVSISYQEVTNSEEFQKYIYTGFMHELTDMQISQYDLLKQADHIFQKKAVGEVLDEIS